MTFAQKLSIMRGTDVETAERIIKEGEGCPSHYSISEIGCHDADFECTCCWEKSILKEWGIFFKPNMAQEEVIDV